MKQWCVDERKAHAKMEFGECSTPTREDTRKSNETILAKIVRRFWYSNRNMYNAYIEICIEVVGEGNIATEDST